MAIRKKDIMQPYLEKYGLLAIIAIVVLMFLFNYDTIPMIYLAVKYLILFGIGIKLYSYVDDFIGNMASGMTRDIISLFIVLVLLYVIRELFLFALLLLIVLYLLR